MNRDLYERILIELLELNEFITMSGGAVGGVATPLGTGPKAGKGGGNIYKKSTATDKKHRSKGKKKKTYTRSVQWYLKNGGEKGRKRSLKESLSFLFEAKTPQLENLSKDQILAFIEHMLGNAVEGYEINMTEKFSGQHVSVLVGPTQYRYSRRQRRTVSKGRMVFVATKQMFDEVKQKLISKGKPSTNIDVMKTKFSDIYTPEEFARSRSSRRNQYDWYKFLNKKGASRAILNAFKYSYPHNLPSGTYKYFGIESLKADDRKGDYISYNIRGRKEYAIVYSGDFTENDAKAMTNPKYNITFMSPSQAERFPQITENYISQLNSIKQEIENYVGRSFKKFITEEVKPQIIDLLMSSLGGSLVASDSPFEGLFVSIKDQIGFKIPNPYYSSLQRIQSPFAAAFDKESVNIRKASRSLLEVAKAINTENVENITSSEVRKTSTGYHILNYFATLSNLSFQPYLRVFFTPQEFDELTQELVDLINNPTITLSNQIIRTISNKVKSKDWHITTDQDEYQNENIQTITESFNSLLQKIEEIKNLNLV